MCGGGGGGEVGGGGVGLDRGERKMPKIAADQG